DNVLKKIVSDGKVESPEKVSGAVGAVGIIDNLHQMYASEKDSRIKAEADRDKALADLKAASDRNDELQKNIGEQLAKLGSKVDELQNAKSEFEKTKSAEITALATQISSKRDELDNMRREATAARRKLIEELSQREQLLDEQKTALSMLR